MRKRWMKRSLLAEEYITDDVLFVGTLRRLVRRCLDNEALQSIRVQEVIIQINLIGQWLPWCVCAVNSALQINVQAWMFIQSNQPSAFRLPWLRFSVIFLSCKANARVYDTQSGHGPHSPPQARRLHLSAWQKVAFATDWASLGSEPWQPTNQSLSLPQLVYAN